MRKEQRRLKEAAGEIGVKPGECDTFEIKCINQSLTQETEPVGNIYNDIYCKELAYMVWELSRQV